MALGHEKLDVYRLAIDYVGWVFEQANELGGIHRHARDQWLRASQSMPLNIVEGNAKAAEADRRRYFVPSQRRHPPIARGSALECAAIQDVLRVSGALEQSEHEIRKNHLDRISAMLTKLGGRGYFVEEDSSTCRWGRIDSDSDSEKNQPQPFVQGNGG